MGSFDATTCRRTLADHYKRTATVSTSVWSKKSPMDIHQIYTRLSWVKEEETPAGSSQSELSHYTDVFTANEKGVVPKRILVQGQTGIGKSTFVKKLAVDWAELDEQKIEGERRRLVDEENSRKEDKESSQCEFLSGGEYEETSSDSDEKMSRNQEDALRKFDILLVINLREVSKYQKLQDIINHSHIFPEEEAALTEGLLSYITKNQEKVLLVFDGYDEYHHGKNSEIYEIFRGNKLRHCSVLITARISKADELREFKDVHAEITGFNKEDRGAFMSRMLGGKEEAEQLKLHLSREELTDLARIPLLLLFFCTLWKKGKLKTFPETKTKLYLAIVQYVLDYSQGKNTPARFGKVEAYKEILSEIGKVALECLLKGEHVFEYDQLSAAVLGEESLIIGLLQVSEYSENLRPAGMVSFLHKSIQEFLAALYITYRCVPEGSLGEIEKQARTLEDFKALENVFQFVCGLSDNGAERVSQHFTSVRRSDPTLDLSKTVPYAGGDEDVLRIPGDFTHGQKLFSSIVINSFQDVHSKAEFVRHCFHCTGGFVLASRPLYERAAKVTDLTKLTHSGVFIFVRFCFSELYEWLMFLNCLDLPLRMTEFSEVFSVGDFLRRFYTTRGYGGPNHFSSILSFRDGQFHFYITALELGHDDHVRLFTETATIPFLRQPASLRSEQLCLKFLTYLCLLKCLSSQAMKNLGAMIRICKNLKSIQVIESDGSICYLLDQIPKPRTCSLKIGQKGMIPCILTSEGAESLAGSFSRFNNIVSLYLGLFDCRAVAVDKLVAGIVAHKSLKNLSLCGIHVTPTAAASLGKALEMLSLRSLCLKGPQGSSLQAKDINMLFGRIKKPIPMEEFSFQCFSVKGCLSPLTKSLPFFTNLRSLSLTELNMDESDLAGLQESSRFIPNLDSLDLSGNPLAHFLTSVLPLITIMFSQGFKNLNLRGTGISKESIREAFLQLPPPLCVEYEEKRVKVIKISSIQENYCLLSISFS